MDNLRRPGNGGLVLAKPLIPGNWKDGYRYGVEIEIEGRGLPRNNDFYHGTLVGNYGWTSHEDGSLRGENCEYVFEGATPYKEGVQLIENLFNAFDAKKSHLVPSNRTSAHIHVNMTGLKLNQINSFVVLWFTFERAIINTCGEYRKNNHFCLSSKETTQIPNLWYNALKRGRFQFSNDYKYAALNFAAFSRFGTLEARCFPMPTKAEDILKWLAFMHGMRQMAVENYLDPTKIARDLSEKGPFEMIRDICVAGGCLPLAQEIRSANSNLVQECMEGFRSIQEAVFEYDWTELLGDFDREHVDNPFEQPVVNPVRGNAPRARMRPLAPMVGDDPAAPLPNNNWNADLENLVVRHNRNLGRNHFGVRNGMIVDLEREGGN